MALKGYYRQNFKRHYTSAMASKVTDPSETRRFTNSRLFNKNYFFHISSAYCNFWFSVSLFVFPILTQESLDIIDSNFD